MSDRYPNIEAIATGCVAGNFREWPMVRPEAKRLLAERDQLLAALTELVECRKVVCAADTIGHASRLRAAWAAAERLIAGKTE